MLDTPGEWEKSLAEQGIPYEPDGDTGVPAMLEYIKDATFDLDKNTKLNLVMVGIVPLALKLMEYRWHVVGRREGTPDFITSDMPLVALWSPGMEKRRPPFFGEPGNALRFPLDRNFILHGISNGRLHSRQLDRTGVEEANAYTAFHSDRFVYCSSDSFAAKFADEPFGGVKGILHAHKRRRLIHDMSGGPGFQNPSPEEIKSWMRLSPR